MKSLSLHKLNGFDKLPVKGGCKSLWCKFRGGFR